MKIEGNYLVFDTETIKSEKITGTTIPSLLGIDKFKKKGNTLLSMWGFVKEDFDEFYTKRGELAEKIAKFILKKRGKQIVTYNAEELKWDNFQNIKGLGGLIDIEIPSEETLYEIKSKSLKDYEYICKNGQENQERQALHYGCLRNYKVVHIMWIFFDEQTENEIRNNLPITTLKNIKMFEKPLYVDLNKLQSENNEALTYLLTCYKEKRIPLDDISDSYLEKLGLQRPQDSFLDTLPSFFWEER